MIRSIIVDDENNSREALSLLLAKLPVKILAEAKNIKEAVISIKEHKPDLVFLDIEMPEEDGFALFNYFEKIDFQVIFITASNKYAIKAFKFSAIDYLLKPIDFLELQEAIEKVDNKKPSENLEERLGILSEHMTNKTSSKIVLPTLKGYHFIEIDNITWFQAEENYCRIHKDNGEQLLSTMNLGNYEDLLPSKSFFRSHRSAIINFHFVEQYLKKEGGQLILKNGTVVPLARRRKDEFMTRFANR